MGSRPAPDRYELAGVDELRELAVSLFRLQVQKLLDVAPFDCPALLVCKLHYEFRVSILSMSDWRTKSASLPDREYTLPLSM